MRCLCFISPFTKKEALQTATFTPLLAALLNELKPFSIYTWKYTTHKKIRVMVSVQAFLLTVKNCGGGLRDVLKSSSERGKGTGS